MKPNSLNILGKEYKIVYCDKPSEVDIFKRDSLWGQVDYWTRTIRIYDYDRPAGDITQVLLHEIIHAITTELHIETITKASDMEDVVDLLALGIADVLERNNLLI